MTWVIVTTLVSCLSMWAVARWIRAHEARWATEIGADGIRVHDELVAWDDVVRVLVLTTRSRFGPTGLEFEITPLGGGPIMLDANGELGRSFLTEAYRLPGFDHDAIPHAVQHRDPQVVCFQR